MRISIPAESRPGETRVAATPETVKKLAPKHEVIVQAGAGLHASVTDEAYVAAGARIVSAAEAFGADWCSRCAPQCARSATLMQAGHRGGRHAQSLRCREQCRDGGKPACTAFALEAAPRITRAQSMDVLSSRPTSPATRP
jgi:NAD(P) transhydrogenase subunit alpha